MTRFLLAGAAALATLSGTAMAQSGGPGSTTQETTTITQPAVAPVITSNTVTNGSAVHSDGDQTAMAGTAFSNSAGNKTETTITNQSYPLTGMITTTRKTTRIVNGVATETVTTTNTFPPWANAAPQSSTTTRTYIVGSR
jgi:hypothetical protein